MKTRKSTKRALLTSILSLLLCCSMLIGTTFAWFTDEVKSANNIITAGNLDVELYNAIGIEQAHRVNSATKLFDEIIYWEPGVVACENLTVANLGTLALKYSLQIRFTNATSNGNGGTLVDVLKVGLVEGGIPEGTSREDSLKLVNDWKELKDFARDGELRHQNATDIYGLVIWWQPSDKDNDFNMNNDRRGQTLSIDLGVMLFATQMPHESDSFGDHYDEGAELPELDPDEDQGNQPGEGPGTGPNIPSGETQIVTDLNGLKNALANGGKIKLDADIQVDQAIEITKNVELDLHDHTLSGTTSDAILIIYAGAVTITDSGWEKKGAIVNNGSGTAVYVDGSAAMISTMSLVDDDTQQTAASTPTLTLEGGALRAGEHGLLAVGATVIINKGTVSGKNGISVQYANIVISGGKLIGTGYGLQAIGATVEITSGTVTGEAGMYMEGAEVSVLGGTMTGTDYGMIIKDAHVKIKSGTLTGGIGSVEKDEDSALTINGGHFSDDTELKAAGLTYQSYTLQGKTYYVVGPKILVKTVEDLNTAASQGGLVILQNSLWLSAPIDEITKDLTLDLNGYSLNIPEEDYDHFRGMYECDHVHLLTTRNVHMVIIDGGKNSGGIDNNDHSEVTAVYAIDSKLTIDGGSFCRTPSAMIADLQNSELHIYSGRFEWFDVTGSTEYVSISGGSFVNSLEVLDSYMDTDVYTGYRMNDYYQIVPIPVIKTFGELQNALGKYGKIILGADIVASEPLTITGELFFNEVLIDLNGHTISGSCDETAVLTVERWSSFKLKISNGSIVNTGKGPGISVRYCECDVVMDANVTGGDYGIYVESCNNVHIEGPVTGTIHGLYAVRSNELAIGASVTGGQCGIYLDEVSNANIYTVTVSGSDYGIYAVNNSRIATNKSNITGNTAVYLDETSTIDGKTIYIPSEHVSALPTDTIQDGDKIVIYHPETVLAIGSRPRWDKLSGEGVTFTGDRLDSDAAASWIVSVDENGYYSFICHGMYLTSGERGNSLTLEETSSEFSLWILEKTDGGWYIKNANAAHGGNPQYLEYYGDFTTYGFKESGSGAYLFQFYIVTE